MLSIGTVQGRLWAALALLAVAVLAVSAVTWFALQRVDARLQDLHQETLSQVADALYLSKRSADLATSAPYLLNQRSNAMIAQEGSKLIRVLDSVRQDWPQTRFGTVNAGKQSVSDILDDMTSGVTDLVAASGKLDDLQAAIRRKTGRLGTLRNAVANATSDDTIPDQVRLIWWSLQSMNADGLNAAYAGNLIGVGEEQRQYLRQRDALQSGALTPQQAQFLADLESIVWGDSGLFELRRAELSSNLAAQNALFRIRQDANAISNIASSYADQAEVFLAGEREASSRTIASTRVTVAVISIISLSLALAAAIYVSRYVTANISRVASAMVRLANGDHAIALPRKVSGQDEISDLFRSFRSFRANALRLDRSNKQLDQRNALFEKVFVNISDGIAITDATGRITGRNPAFRKILRLGPAKGRSEHIIDAFSASRFGADSAAVALSHNHRGFYEITADDGQVLEVRASKLPDDGRVWLVSDITERRRISDRLQQIDRMETLGKVAGETAHDFANILSTIRTHHHLLTSQESGDPKNSLDAIENAVDFGATMTDRLLTFARKQSLRPELVNLNGLIEGMAELIEISLKPDVKLEMSLPEKPLLVSVDPGQFESAIFNLLLNANHAIADSGTIKINLVQTANGHAGVIIEDDGEGMPMHVLNHAIEPFFTTREGQGGTGLGLSIVYGFISQTGGDLNIESTVGKGTRIEVTLPLVKEQGAPLKVPPSRKCLLVEDDTKTRSAIKTLLSDLGFEVTACEKAGNALKCLGNAKYDLLLSDLDLGGEIDGVAIVAAARQTMPDLQTIIMSGKSSGKAYVPDQTGFIEKPVTADLLKAKILNNTARSS